MSPPSGSRPSYDSAAQLDSNDSPPHPTPKSRQRDDPHPRPPDHDELLFAREGSVTSELLGDRGKERVPLTPAVWAWCHAAVGTATSTPSISSRGTTAPGQSLGSDDPSTASENDGR
jgi:hypothetical protein